MPKVPVDDGWVPVSYRDHFYGGMVAGACLAGAVFMVVVLILRAV